MAFSRILETTLGILIALYYVVSNIHNTFFLYNGLTLNIFISSDIQLSEIGKFSKNVTGIFKKDTTMTKVTSNPRRTNISTGIVKMYIASVEKIFHST